LLQKSRRLDAFIFTSLQFHITCSCFARWRGFCRATLFKS
jgi:hypothetical protein